MVEPDPEGISETFIQEFNSVIVASFGSLQTRNTRSTGLQALKTKVRVPKKKNKEKEASEITDRYERNVIGSSIGEQNTDVTLCEYTLPAFLFSYRSEEIKY